MKKIKNLSFIMAIIMVVLPCCPLFSFIASATTTYEASIGETKYATLEEALAAVQAGETITLLSDVDIASGDGFTINTTNCKSTTFTVDGNGYTVTGNISGSFRAVFYLFASGGEVTFKNLTINSVTGNANAWGAVIARQGKINLENCNLNVSGTAGKSAIGLNSAGTVTLKDTQVTSAFAAILDYDGKGNIEATNTFITADSLVIDNNGNETVSSINGITLSSMSAAMVGSTKYLTVDEAITAVAAGGTVTLLRDTEMASTTGIETSKSYTLDGNGYTLSATVGGTNKGALYVKAGSVLIKNITLDITNASTSAFGAVISRYSGTTVTLENCHIKVYGTQGLSATLANGGGKLILNGNNTIDTCFAAFYVPSGVAATITATSTDRIYAPTSVTPSTTVTLSGGNFTTDIASIGDTTYATLPEAFKAAKEGDTVCLNRSIENTTTTRIKCYAGGFNITLDGQGNYITSGTADVTLAIHHDSTLDQDNGGVLNLLIKDLTVKNTIGNASATGTALQTNSSTNVTLENTVISADANSLAAIIVQASSTLVVKGDSQIVTPTSCALMLNGAGALADIYDATIVTDRLIYSNNNSTTLNVYNGADITITTTAFHASSAKSIIINVMGGKVTSENSSQAIITTAVSGVTANIYGGHFRGGNAIYSNTGSSKSVNYSSSLNSESFMPVMTDGAAVRLAPQSSGLRFETTIPQNLISHINAVKDSGTSVEYGTVITPRILS